VSGEEIPLNPPLKKGDFWGSPFGQREARGIREEEKDYETLQQKTKTTPRGSCEKT